jgi:hypothetical protein
VQSSSLSRVADTRYAGPHAGRVIVNYHTASGVLPTASALLPMT